MKKNLFWILCPFLLMVGLVGCSNENEYEEQKEGDLESVTKRTNFDDLFYGIDITDSWCRYWDYDPNRAKEISAKLRTDQLVAVQVILSEETVSHCPDRTEEKLDMNPFVDHGWRIYTDGSGGERTFLTHKDLKYRGGGWFNFYFPADSHRLPYTCEMRISAGDGTYSTLINSNIVDGSYSLYVYIGTDFYSPNRSFTLKYKSYAIPVTGQAEIISTNGYPKWGIYPSSSALP